MKRYILLASIVTVVLVISGCTNNKYSNETMNNKSKTSTETATIQFKNDLKKTNIEESRDFDTSLKNGSVIMISRDNSNELEVYNIATLDKFIESFNNGKEGYVRIIKGTIVNGKLFVNKLDEYETDGKVVKSIPYDPYLNEDKFTAGRSNYCPKIVKTYSANGIRYALLESKDTPDNMGTTVISFDKNSIKN
jgi:hypothetical protein